MTPRSLQAVLRTLVTAEAPASDSELLRRVLQADRADEAAFAELVRRHGRLVWAVCRNLTGSDAEADDAFQATFLVLLRNAKKIREGGRLSAWLHGVAAKVCSKARQAAKRRTAREQATAVSERNGRAVPDSAWDRALAAVHEEAAKLPETLRVPFVLCCLEGKGVTEAAEQLGWKLGTFSGRLTRAKDALLAKLDARGLTLGAVAGLGLVLPSEAVVAKAIELAQVGFAVPSSVLQLTQGVIGMSLKSVKLLAAAVLLTCGLGFGVGNEWLATADAQDPTKPLAAQKQPPAKLDPADEVKRLQLELEYARRVAEAAGQLAQQGRREAELQKERALREVQEALAARDALANEREALLRMQRASELTAPAAKTSKWEYDFVPASDLDKAGFVKVLNERETKGWEFAGTTTLRTDGKPTATWVFRRATKVAVVTLTDPLANNFSEPAELRMYKDWVGRFGGKTTPATPEDAKAIEAQIDVLKEKLAKLKALEKAPPARPKIVFTKNALPLDAPEMIGVLTKFAEKKFTKDRYTISVAGTGLVIEGDQEVVDWFATLMKKLADK